MEDSYSNELMEVSSTSTSKSNGRADENTLQLMQNFTSTVIELSQQISENNAAKYKAQAEVLIADIQAKMQEECQDINGYYKQRERQEEHINKIITFYQEQFNKLTNRLLETEDELAINNVKLFIEKLESSVGQQLDIIANNIARDQNTRLAACESRKKSMFSFFRR